MVGYGVNKTCNTAAMVGKQARHIKHCDQVVIAGFKRCHACVYSSYAMRDERHDDKSCECGNERLYATARLLVIAIQRTYTTFRKLLVFSNSIPLHSGRCPVS
jgi:hypothetical protein